MERIIGKQIPEFKVQAFVDNEFKEISKKDVLGKWGVFFFYPADFTFVCPTELEDIADHYAKLKAEGVEVYGVSCDTHFVHKAWHDESETIKKVQFPLLGDPTAQLSKALGIYIEEEGLSLRASFVFNPEGEIKAYEVHDNGIGRDAAELVRKIEAAKFVAEYGDQVCPAKWRPGSKTLKPGIDLVGKI